jgi:hypothetical protein
MNSCQRCHALLSEYLERTLSASDRDEVAAHLETCSDCRSELRELELTKSALVVLSPVAAPDDLRRRVRVALHNEAQKKPTAGFFAGLASWRPQQFVWTGTLTFSALALLLLVRPATLNSPQTVSPELASPDVISEDGNFGSPVPNLKSSPKTTNRTSNGSSKLGNGGNVVTHRATNRLESPAVPLAKARRERARQAETNTERSTPSRPAPPALRQAEPAPISRPNLPSTLPSTMPPAVTLPPQGNLMRRKVTPPSVTPRSAGATRESAPSHDSSAPNNEARKIVLGAPRIASARFSFEIAEVPPSAPEQEGTVATKAAPVPEAVDSIQSAGESAPSTFAAPVAPPVRKGPVEENAAAQGFSARGLGPGTGGSNARRVERKAADGAAASARAPEPSVMARSVTPNLRVMNPVPPRVFQLAVTAPRDLKNTQLRVEVPSSLRFEKEAAEASRVVWSGDLTAGQVTRVSLELLGVRGGEKISVFLEQKSDDGKSKAVETQKLTLPVMQK